VSVRKYHDLSLRGAFFAEAIP